MVVAKRKHEALLKKLQHQVKLLQHKATISRSKLQTAMKKMRALDRAYYSEVRLIKAKVVKAQEINYARTMSVLEQRMLKRIEAKCKALATAVLRLEKKLSERATKLTKSRTTKK